LKDVGPAVVATAAVITLIIWQEKYFSDWPDKPPTPWLPKTYATGRLEEPPTFPSKKISPDEWKKRNMSLWYPIPRIKTHSIKTHNRYTKLSYDGCFIIGTVFTPIAIYKWFHREIIFPSVSE